MTRDDGKKWRNRRDLEKETKPNKRKKEKERRKTEK